MHKDTKILAYLKSSLLGLREMEIAALPFLEHNAAAFKSCPDLMQKIASHKAQSSAQIGRLGDALKKIPSHEGIGQTRDYAAFIHMMMDDLHPHPVTAQYVVEHYEISQYKMLIETARSAGFDDIALLCEESLCEEEEMAHWIDFYMPDLLACAAKPAPHANTLGTPAATKPTARPHPGLYAFNPARGQSAYYSS